MRKIEVKFVYMTLGELRSLVKYEKSNRNHYYNVNDAYDLYNWLIKRFDKSVGDFYDIYGGLSYSTNVCYDKDKNGLDVECCYYKFTYPKK